MDLNNIPPLEAQSLPQRLRIRAAIRRQARGRKSVQEGAADRLSDLLEEAAARIETLEEQLNNNTPIV